MSAQEQLPNFAMEKEDFYLEEVFTDRRVGTIRRLTPVTPEGLPDDSRSVLYAGQTQVMTPAGALPLTFDIEAESLDEAIDKYGDEARIMLEKTMEEIREMRRESASSIVVPGSGGFDPSGGAPGGAPGGGLQF